MINCIFCNIIEKNKNLFLDETEDIIVLKDIYPNADIHELIIPKKHFTNLSECDSSYQKILSESLLMAKKRSKFHGNCDFKVVINNGKDVGQTVFHSHIHFLAGKIKKSP